LERGLACVLRGVLSSREFGVSDRSGTSRHGSRYGNAEFGSKVIGHEMRGNKIKLQMLKNCPIRKLTTIHGSQS
jgi:hypothetical protein